MGHSSCKTPNKAKTSPTQWGRGKGFVHRLFIYRRFLEKKVRRRKEERKRKVRCRAINTYVSKPGLVQSSLSPFPSYILFLSCYNKTCLLKTNSLWELWKWLLCSGYLQSTDGCLKLLFLMRTTDAGHLTIIRAASSPCLMSAKPLRSVTATPSAKLLYWLTRQLGQVGSLSSSRWPQIISCLILTR